MTTKDYIEYKAKVLRDLGIKNKEKLKAFLTSETKDINTEYSQQEKVDRLCRNIIENYFNGDITFVRK